MDKNRTNKLSCQGFIQIPIFIIVGMLIMSASGYYLLKDKGKIPKIQGVDSPIQEIDLKNQEEQNELKDKRENSDKMIDLEKYKKVENSSGGLLNEFKIIKSEVDSFNSYLFEVKNEIIESEVKLSDLRIKNVKKVKLFAGTDSSYIVEIFNQIIQIEEARKKQIEVMTSSIYTKEFIAYKISLNSMLNDFSSYNESKIKNVIQEHQNKMKTIQELSDKKIKEVISESDLHSITIQKHINTFIDLAKQNVEIDSMKEDIDKLKESIQYEESMKDGYLSIPIYKPSSKANLTPEQQCAQRKAGALSNYIGEKIDCSDLGIYEN